MQPNAIRATMLALFLLPFSARTLTAQNLETFESIVASAPLAKPTVFVNNAQSFTITTGNCSGGGTFGVFIPSNTFTHCAGSPTSTNGSSSTYGVGTSCASGVCSGTSAKFIDNAGNQVFNQIYSIKTTNAALFTIKSLYVFLSSDNALTPSAAGGIIFRGKVNGNTVFTYTKTTGFTTNYLSNNGFTFIDFVTAGNASTNINELEMQTGASSNYFAVDNFTWGISVPLSVSLTSFTASPSTQSVDLKWSAARESKFSHYELEHSADGKSFTTITTQKSAAGLATYSFTDYNYVAGNNFYRLRMVDQDGAAAYSSVVSVMMNEAGQQVKVYPNPATDKLFVVLTQNDAAATFQLTDMTGRLVQTLQIKGQATLQTGHLPKGIYQYRLVTRQGVMQQGKITLN
jgi:hypothetical protein